MTSIVKVCKSCWYCFFRSMLYPRFLKCSCPWCETQLTETYPQPYTKHDDNCKVIMNILLGHVLFAGTLVTQKTIGLPEILVAKTQNDNTLCVFPPNRGFSKNSGSAKGRGFQLSSLTLVVQDQLGDQDVEPSQRRAVGHVSYDFRSQWIWERRHGVSGRCCNS